MVTEENIQTASCYTSGFSVSLPSPMEIEFSEGVYSDGYDSYSYEPFSFDVEADPEFPVVYDVYLTTDGVTVSRTVFAGGNVPCYEGEPTLLHTLCTFLLPENTENLEDVDILVRKVSKREEGQSE